MAERPTFQLTGHDERVLDPSRLLAFSDGVLAIVITILVLELKVPSVTESSTLADALSEVRPTFVAFVISFFIVGAYWVWHRRTFSSVRYANTVLVWLNLFALFSMALIPFATGLLGSANLNATSIRVYALVVLVASVAELVVDLYLEKKPVLLWEPIPTDQKRVSRIRSAFLIGSYGLAVLLAAATPWLSLILFALGPVLYLGILLGNRHTRVSLSGPLPTGDE